MISLILNIQNSSLQKLLSAANASNTTIDSLVESLINTHIDTAPKKQVEEPINMLEEAIRRTTSKKTGETFRLQDLFETHEWKPESPTSFGREFRKEVETRLLAKHIDRDSQNKAVYKRI